MMKMTCTVLLFAQLAEEIGADSVFLDLNTGATVNDAIAELAARYPKSAGTLKSVAVAIDERYASRETVVPDRAVLAVIPPVSGG